MSVMIGTVKYYDSMGKVHTEETLTIARDRAQARGLEYAIAPSGGGYTAEKALDIFKDSKIKLIIVGFKRSFPQEIAEKVTSHGHRMLCPSDHKFDHPTLGWETLRRFCGGMKVCCQIAMMATEAGYIPEGVEVVSVGGTGGIEFEPGGGVDTAIVIGTVSGSEFFSPEDSA